MPASDIAPTPKNNLKNDNIRSSLYKNEESDDLAEEVSKEQVKKSCRIIGPFIPEDFLEKKGYKDENENENEEDISFPEKTGKIERIMGSERVESDEDEIGPSISDFLNISNVKEDKRKRAIEFEKIEEKRLNEIRETNNIKTNEKKRDDWMIVPPDASHLNIGAGVKARTFNTGKSARLGDFGVQDMNLWTESYEEKQKRLKQEAIGAKTPSYQANLEKEASNAILDTKKQKTCFENKRPSLYDMHVKTNKKMIDDPSKRMFDREKDVLNENYMNFEKRQKLMNFAKDLSRFSSGSYL
ncbi:hypothetical protein T552_00443 [Pneumocystis carinii B80]|uniref:DUF3752 domain-containing protein n=1 Tax=Pneumocystis carinii (strain B80) TaxID=1408658 RepID=A0A0W4ZQS8_PNEC8|nr:hypothetical protein T552_00443 [Pneumocystis carinii B80]KTW30731.1 hypothetical protein T552_00443 [Pneumocystis carinii B80]